MIFKQYYLQSLSHASYLVGDEESHIAAIIDPQRDIDQYLNDLDFHHVTLKYTFLTIFTQILWPATLNFGIVPAPTSILVLMQKRIICFTLCDMTMK